MTNEIIKDFGEITCPVKWEDVTLKKYEELEEYYSDKDEKKVDIRDIIHIMIGKDIDYVNNLPFDAFNIILEKLAFIQTPPSVEEPSNKLIIDGETYQVNIQNKLKTGEYVAFDSVLRTDSHNYAAMLAILCRKEGEIYDSRFENEILEDRIKLFEKQSVVNILPIISFFLTLSVVLGTHSHLYTVVEEELNHIAKSIKDSQKIGLYRKLYLTWQITKLKRSLKSISNTSMTSSLSSRSLSRKVKRMRRKRNIKKT